MQYAYLGSLLATLAALMLIDRRLKLLMWHDARRTVRAVVAGVVVLSVWDLLGIHFGIFFSGHSRYALDWFLLPNFPPEELVFLTMLCYLALLLQRVWERR